MLEMDSNAPAVAEPSSKDSEKAFVSRIRELISEEKFASARRLAETAVQQHPAGRELQLLQKALHPGRATGRRLSDSGHRENMAWLSRHQEDHAGEWVALVDGELVAAAAELTALLASLKRLSLGHRPLIHHIRG